MALKELMTAVHLTGHGGYDKLVLREDLPVPKPGPQEVLIEVGACGMNNTDINTRVGWYSKSVRTATADAGDTNGQGSASEIDTTWSGNTVLFPRIQGADVAGRIVAVGPEVPESRIGERVLVDPWIRDRIDPQNRRLAGYLGSERDGGLAQYTAVPQENAFVIESQLSDAELATFPCAYSTAEHMLERVRLQAGERIFITGASGGVGSALVQLAKRRKAQIFAVTSASKVEQIHELGANHVFTRDQDNLEQHIQEAAAGGEVDVVVDVVGGDGFSMCLNLLSPGGRYVTSGAIAGPIVELDLRTLYLKDLEMHGATVMPVGIFETLVTYIEKGEIKPLLVKQFPLSQIRKAQAEFLKKAHVGNFVILPWP
jgi:NADPH:quinone reductase-like Zn-dependent oxidoreductase